LREIVDQNLRGRRSEARKADQIIAEGVAEYLEEIRGLGAVDMVKQYRQMAEELSERELQRALRGLARGQDPRQLLTQLARGLTNKLIHAPTAGLKQASAEGRHDRLLHARSLLGLEETAGDAGSAAGPERAEDFDLPPGAIEPPRRTLQ
jgi:glutamyl-tRNA reductase